MWVSPGLKDARIIAHYVGLFVIGVGMAMLVPLVTALLYAEWDSSLDYAVGIGVAFAVGGALRMALPKDARLTHAHALALTGLGWLAASAAAAVPLALSGNYASYVDALFDAVSGFTTSGLTVARDLDHMSYSHNMWRHLTHLIGGQGIVVAALSLAVGLRGGAVSMYLAEGRDERILPNVLFTTRFIWFVTAVYVGLGTLVLTGVHTYLGMAPARGVLHAFWISVAAYDTGGFGPQSMNAMYYHSYLFEAVSVFLMLAGTMNFNLHAQVWRGDRTELWKNIETRVLAVNILILSGFVAAGMAVTGTFTGPLAVIRKGAYHILSAHSGTGHQTLYPNQWSIDAGGAAFAAILLAMAAGGAVSSTAGGIKALRFGVLIKAVQQQIKVAMSPRSAVTVTRYHHLGDRLLTPEITSAAAIVFIMYIVTYVTGGLVGAAFGYPAADAMFESISAAANVGLTTGITSPAMPIGLKLFYIFQMWIGRLEFVAALTLLAYVVLGLRPRSGRRTA